eukprot:763848-Hanusia_phi.AAC.1
MGSGTHRECNDAFLSSILPWTPTSRTAASSKCTSTFLRVGPLASFPSSSPKSASCRMQACREGPQGRRGGEKKNARCGSRSLHAACQQGERALSLQARVRPEALQEGRGIRRDI